nr:hypothetical protein [Tanacetum cinerariifolium]
MSHGSYGAMWKSFVRDREVTSTNVSATRAAPKVGLEEEVAAMGPLLSKKHRKRVNDGADANAPPKIPTKNVATMEVPHTHSTKSAGSGKSTSSTSMVGSPKDHIVSSGYFSELCHMPNVDFLSQYNKNLAQHVAIGCQLRLHFKQEVRLLKKPRAQVARLVESEVHRLKSQAKNLNTLLEAEVDIKKAAKTQVTSEEMIKAAFEEFKKYEDGRVEKHCAKMDARRDALSIDFDKELYPHMLTVIVGRRWVIGHGMLLAVMKCAESIELRQVFANSCPRGLPKSDSKEDAPKWIRDLRPSTPQLKIPLYPEVRDPRDPRAIKEEMLLKDAIAANVISTEKKKKCQVVCRTHGVGFAHYARSNGIPVSAPTVAPQARLRHSSSKSKFSRSSSSLCTASTATVRASTFLFLLHGTWFIENLVKPLTRILTFSRPAISASYSASLLEAINWNLSAVSMALAEFPPLMRLANFRPASLPGNPLGFVLSQTSLAVITAIGCAWKYLRSLLATKTSDRTSFSIGEVDMYTISSSFGLGATSRGSSDKCCFNCLKACSAFDVQWKLLFLMHFFKVLNGGKDFFADLERNLFRLANFPLRLWTSLIVRGDENLVQLLFCQGMVLSLLG